jgi:hypothetical protein
MRVSRFVGATAVSGARRGGQYLTFFVVADGLDVHAAKLRQFTDRQASARAAVIARMKKSLIL